MTIISSEENSQELFVDENSIHTQSTEEFEIFYQLPEDIGDGYCRDFELCKGLHLSIDDYKLSRDTINTAFECEHPVEFVIDLTGSNDIPIHREIEYDKYIGTPKSYLIGSGIAPTQTIIEHPFQPYKGISVHIEPDLLKTFFSKSSGELPEELKLLIIDNDWQNRFPPSKLTPEIQVVTHQIIHCPYHGLTKRMFLQAKVFELLALLLEIPPSHQLETNNCKLKSQDIERIHYAKDIVEARLEHPLSLFELAQTVGLNEFKLKNGFRQIFGTTVFKHLHNCRMEKARQLLQEGNYTVTQVAWTVGFANRGDFAAAFRRKFGVNPSIYLRQVR